ncbi:hypothetical protein E2C01_043292 [Portunus trituberculatus]|uniref:Uncharacterized protein n=1 Tax=Portunus trituberculatus TaxID=210409 RepID=A0A5B7FP36_PORTR|nr:hypothetical protein [Portunus trituberculatus]
MQQQVFWGVRLCRASMALGRVRHVQLVHVGIEVDVANSHPGDWCPVLGCGSRSTSVVLCPI